MMSIEDIYHFFLKSTGITTDSRKCKVGNLFFALKGDNFDGNLYAKSAIENGCSYAFVDDPSLSKHENMIVVDSVLESLQQLAKFHRIRLGIPVIGITGTNGKTTTKELVAAVLKKKYNVTSTAGNLNNHIGVPLTLLSMTSETEIGIVEMGANHVGEIGFLCGIALPDYGIITNIGKAHIEGFGSYEGVIKAKSELYNYLKENKGSIFINTSDKLLDRLAEGIAKYTYSAEKDIEADVSMLGLEQTPLLELIWTHSNRTFDIETKIIGGYNALNILCSICVGLKFEVPEDDINDAIAAYESDNNRSQIVKSKFNTILLDAYNANPSSMEVALSNFESIAHQKKVVILGGMKELGHVSVDEHKKLCSQISKMDLYLSILVGREFLPALDICKNLYFEDKNKLIEYLKNYPIKDSMILVKGSRSNELEKLKDDL